jgi:CRISPR/Cas system-associated exonuclease Cas4 (RecB family)
MSIIPEKEHSVKSLINRYHEGNQEPPRRHFGLSAVGEPCIRRAWYAFRWVAPEQFPGRILRLFRRGHREEETVIADLHAIGMDIGEAQKGVDFGYAVRGSVDGIIYSGVPEAPKKRHLLEIKTHSDKSFRTLKSKGVESAHPKHYAQMQAYMLGLGLDRALYVAVNKNDDEYYTERVRIDMPLAKKLIEKAKLIVQAEDPGIRISEDPSWYQCKFCPFSSICHDREPVREVNCRTCVHSTLRPDGAWLCERYKTDIPEAVERVGCSAHVIRPHLVPWDLVAKKCTDTTACYRVDGQDVMVGEDGYTLPEVLSGGTLNDDDAEMVREVFDGRIVSATQTVPK